MLRIKPSKNEYYKELTSMLIEEMKQGEVPWKKPWFSKLPTNYKTKKVYRGINVINLLYAAKKMDFESHYWLTEIQAQDLGGRIKEDQKNKPHSVIKAKWESRSWRDSEGIEHTTCWLMIKTSTVFNIEQATGLKTNLTHNNYNLFDYDDKAMSLITKYKNPPQINYEPESSYYRPYEDLIGIPEKDQFYCNEEYYSTLFHELIHSTGHRKRLNRESFRRKIIYGDETYAREELVAEIGAAFLAGYCGFFSQTKKNTAAYLSSWLQGLENDNTILFRSASNAQQAVDFILGELKEEENKEPTLFDEEYDEQKWDLLANKKWG